VSIVFPDGMLHCETNVESLVAMIQPDDFDDQHDA
jgi:hypothetical protein